MIQEQDAKNKQVGWLTAVVFGLGYAILCGVQVVLVVATAQSWAASVSSLLLNLISALTLAAIVFIIFTRKGIALPTARDIAKEVQSMATTDGLKDSQLRDKGLSDFFPSFRQVPWPELVASAKHLDIAVYYFDSWVKANWDDLVSFFRRGCTVNLFLPNPANEVEVRRIAVLFPEYSEQVVREKIQNTERKFRDALEASGSKSARVTAVYLDRPPTYSAIRIDRERVVLSIYESYRHSKIDSSAVLIDVTRDQQLAQYWDKEFGGMGQ